MKRFFQISKLFRPISYVILSIISFSCSSDRYKAFEAIEFKDDAYAIIPQPKVLDINKGAFVVDENTFIVADETAKKESKYLAEMLKTITRHFSKISKNQGENDHTIRLMLSDDIENEEGYTLSINYQKVVIKAKTTTGLFYGIETLRQLIRQQEENESYIIPAANIEDAPRFGYRGMMLDTGRYFYEVDFIKSFIDLIALHKMNVFHWHLTEDQGWRIEIKKYPKLTEIGAWRNGTEIGRTPGKASDNKKHGGFYSQEEIKEIVAYASDRHITIIPEIDMPGHNGAAIASYPFLSCFPEEKTKMNANIISEATKEKLQSGVKKVVQESWGIKSDVLCAGKESTYTFYENVLSEVVDLFPSSYIHIGGDECLKDNWKRCPECQQKIKENGLANEDELQSYFIQHMEQFVNSKGKQIIGWDEILEGGLKSSNATVMSWRGVKGGIEAAKLGQDVIMTPREPYYFDYYQVNDTVNEPLTVSGWGPNTLEDIYTFNPIPEELTPKEQHHVLGIQANLWTEYIAEEDYAEYMLLPRMTALAEVAWSSENADRNFDEFLDRLKGFDRFYEERNLNYATHYFE